MTIVRHSSELPAPASRLFTLLENPRTADQLNPEYLRTRVIDSGWLPRPGARNVTELVFHGFIYGLTTEIVEFRRDAFLLQRQVEGPFLSFEHAVSLEQQPDHTRLTEVLAYAMRFGILGRAFDRLVVRADLERALTHRAARLLDIFGHDDEVVTEPA